MTEAQIKEMVEMGLSPKRIQSKVNLPLQDLKKIIKDNNFLLKKEEFSDDKIDFILKLYAEGVSAKNISCKYGIDKRRVISWAKSSGILRDKNQSHRFTNFNQEVFDCIDSEEKAYWLGFFYADAYNSNSTNTVSISLQVSDLEHLKKLSHFFNLPEGKIKLYKNKYNHQYYNLKIYSKHLCQTLNKLGCPQAKSFIIKYPDWINDTLKVHFIRGMFDGDGSLACRSNKEWKWSLVTTQECAKDIISIIEKDLNIKVNLSYISKSGNNTYEIESNGNKKVLLLSNWLYAKSSPLARLDRKYDKFLALLKQQQNVKKREL